MTREEMLKRLGVTEAELRDFLHRFSQFAASLDPKQRAMLERSMPSMEEARKAFGPDVSEEDLLKLFGGGRMDTPVIVCLPGIDDWAK